jgi:lipoprotein
MKLKAILASAAATLLVACSGSKENPDARALMDEATSAFEAADYNRATSLLDSLQKAFPGELTIQREGMTLRPRVIEKLAEIRIASIDSATIADNATMERIKPLLKWVKTPGMIEGYWTDAKAYNPSFMNATGIEARVSEIGQFYIVSSASPQLKHTAIAVSGPKGEAATQAVPYDGESNYRIGGGEVITFSPEQSDTIGVVADENLSAGATPLTLKFLGGKAKSLKLSQAQAQGIVNAYRYSQALVRARDNQVQRQKLEKTIEIARRQLAAQESVAEANQ